jgi:AcrR family transcriptional regulator
LHRRNERFKRSFVTRIPQETRARLLEAATGLFAERGFHGVGVRDIALRADVNVAAANYHFGSKEDLYLAVLRSQFAAIRARLAANRAKLPVQMLAELDRGELVELLGSRITTMIEMLIGPPPSLHARLMIRELVDPSAALPVAVEEFLRPEIAESSAILARLEPCLDPATVERCIYSSMGQSLFYALARPALLRISGHDEFPADLAREVGHHVTEFTLGGIARLGALARGEQP